MASTWTWVVWTVLLLGFTYYALVTDLGTYEMMIVLAGAIVLSVVATMYERVTHSSKP